MTHSIEIVLFDLGGVLVDFGGVDAMKALAGIETDDELWERWLTCPWVRRFERGGCTDAEFASGMVEEWSLSIAPAEFLAAFRSWPGEPRPGAEALVRRVREVVPIGCLSNTNSAHWHDAFAQRPLLDLFDHRFLSFELGIVKPDREVFDRVVELLGLAPDRILFLDDNRMNVDGAIAAGMNAAHARGVTEATSALVAAGVLTQASGT